MNKKKKAKKTPRYLSLIGTSILIVIILFCLPLTIPRVLGFQIYSVISGSMEPSIPVGSQIYIKEYPPEEIQENDVVAFYSSNDSSSIITHRVVENRTLMGEFITKGDANEKEDMNPISYENFIGKVVFHIPFMGEVALLLTSNYGKIVAIGFIGIALMLHFLQGRIDNKTENEQEKKKLH